MGSALARVWREGGVRVVATAEGRSERTARLAAEAGVELLPTLDAVVAVADAVVSVVPPAEAPAVARAVEEAARRGGVKAALRGPECRRAADRAQPRPDAPRSRRRRDLRAAADAAGHDDRLSLRAPGRGAGGRAGAGTPTGRRPGRDRGRVGREDVHGVRLQGDGRSARARAARRARERRARASARRSRPAYTERVESALARAGAKAPRYVGEMREIAASQAEAGLTPALFEAMAEVWADLARSPLADRAPEELDAADLETVLAALSEAGAARAGAGATPAARSADQDADPRPRGRLFGRARGG